MIDWGHQESGFPAKRMTSKATSMAYEYHSTAAQTLIHLTATPLVGEGLEQPQDLESE